MITIPTRIVVPEGDQGPDLPLYYGSIETASYEPGGQLALLSADAVDDQGVTTHAIVVDHTEYRGAAVWYVWPFEPHETSLLTAGFITARLAALQGAGSTIRHTFGWLR